MRQVVFLYEKEQAIQQMSQQLQYWQIDSKFVEQAFQYAVLNSSIHFQQLAQHLSLQHELHYNALQRLYVFQVGERFVIHGIYTDLEKPSHQKFLRLTEWIFTNHSLQSIPELFNWLQQYIMVAEHYQQTQLASERLSILVQAVQQQQPKSSRLKICKMVELLYLFGKGEQYYSYVLREIVIAKQTWKLGKWALTLKERALFSYMAMTIAYNRQQWKKVIDEARFLLKQDRFMDVSIELIVEYGALLKITQPQLEAIIKNYRKNVFEHFFFMYLEALTQLGQYRQAFDILYNYEIASTSSIFHYLQQPNEENLVRIEAAMQRNIALVVDGSVSYVKQSIDKWQLIYTAIPEAYVSSKYMCFMLETLFICERYDLFERLMEIYVKYLKFEQHYDDLKQRISMHMTLHV